MQSARSFGAEAHICVLLAAGWLYLPHLQVMMRSPRVLPAAHTILHTLQIPRW
jgi:hypothetical protein